ncbi:hypothetical protein Bbelb_133340 [Branchiostoma belcheri]|nr:hypothetical protein Bbelb_133340 [Branchiostoma belcheri]
MRRTSTDYGLLFANAVPPPTKDEVLQLRGDLIDATLPLGIILPAVNALHASRFGPIKGSKGPVALPDKVCELDASLAPAAFCEVSTGPPLPPLPVALHPQVRDKNNIEDFRFTDQECHLVEQATRGQSKNVQWYKQRMGAITSSVAFDISQSYLPHSRASKNRLANGCLHADCISLTKPPETKVESLRYGTEKEKVARTQYFNEMVKQHQDFNIDETGLVVHPEKPFLRASPDGIAKCSSHSSRTIEIKCPFTARDMTVEEAVRTEKIDYLQQGQGDFALSRTKPGYFWQVRGGKRY